jgi:hypothetical protein
MVRLSCLLLALGACNALVGNEDIVAPDAPAADAGAPPPDAAPEAAAPSCANPACMEDLLTGLNNPNDVSADATNVFVTDSIGDTDGAVWRCPTAGCSNATATRIATGEAYPAQVVQDATNVYWVDERSPGGLHTCPRTGCGPSTLLVQWEPEATYRMAVADDSIFYADELGSIYQLPKSGARVGTPLLQSGAVIAAIAYFQGQLVWLSSELKNTRGGILQACTTSDCATTFRTLFAGRQAGATLALDASGIYWIETADTGGASLFECSDQQTCTTPRQLTTGIGTPQRMILDAKNVYFTAQGAVFMCPKAGCATPTSLVTVDGLAHGLATDGTYLYFLSSLPSGGPSGVLHRIPKPS